MPQIIVTKTDGEGKASTGHDSMVPESTSAVEVAAAAAAAASPSSVVPLSEEVEESISDHYVAMAADINTAAALRAQYAIETPRPTRRRHKKGDFIHEEEPLIDNTAPIPLHSKRTDRQQKRQQKRSEKAAAAKAAAVSILSLPIELLTDVLNYLQPSDVFRLLRTSKEIRDVVLSQENLVAKEIIYRRYWTIRRCFPIPIPFENVPEDVHAALLSSKRQEMLNIHRMTYHQHVQMIDPHIICTCMTCVFAWNNLCLILDLNHWQHNLEHREPIPMIARGTNPEWNQGLLQRNANIVQKSMYRPLVYAAILEKYLDTIVGTLLRMPRSRRKTSLSSSSSKAVSTTKHTNHTKHIKHTGPSSASQSSSSTSISTSTPTSIPNVNTTSTPRPYQMTDEEARSGTDKFLDRYGPPSYDFPFHRDVYYNLEVYMPNRKWSKETRRWHYYADPPAQHMRDLDWVRSSMRRWTAVGNELLKNGSGAGAGAGAGPNTGSSPVNNDTNSNEANTNILNGIPQPHHPPLI